MAGTKARMFGSIAKVEDLEDGTIMVEGVANAPTPDSDGETFTAECMKGAIPDYMQKRRALREMHQPIAAGVTKDMWVDDEGVTRIRAHVVDPVSVKKVQTGVLKMFSIEGVIPAGGRDAKNRKLVHKLNLREVSLVDVGAHPDAMIEVVKLDKPQEEEAPMAQEQTPAGEAPETTTTAKAADQQAQEALDTVKKWAGEEIMDARRALECLDSLFYLFLKEGAEGEAAQAGDLKIVTDKLRAFIAAEIMEDNSTPAPGTPVALADGPKPGEDGVAKAGAKFSKATKEDLAKMKKALSEATECMKAFSFEDDEEGEEGDGAKKVAGAAEGEDMVAKAAGLTDQVAKLEGEKVDLVAKLDSVTAEKDRLAAELDKAEKAVAGIVEDMKAKGVLRIVEKTTDGEVKKAQKTKVEAETTDPLDAIRKVHAAGGTILTNSAR